MKPIICLFLAISIWLFSFVFLTEAVMANDLANGAEVFKQNCSGCHVKGGNIVRRGKNLKLKTLKKNGLDSVELISQLVRQGKNNMSAYQDRLTPTEIENVAAYVLTRAQENWK